MNRYFWHLYWITVVVFGCLILNPDSADADRQRKFDGDPEDFFTAYEYPATEERLRLLNHAHTDRIMEWVRNGELQYALADCKYVLDRFPNHPRGLVSLESVGKIMEFPAIAIPYYEKALSLFPQHAITHAQFGRYLIEIGKADEGIAKLKRAIEMDSNLKPAYVWLAEGYYKKGDHEQARLAARKAKALGYTGEFPADLQSSSAR